MEFEVTKGFINLGEKITECQAKESFENCQTREYLKLAQEKCACKPLSLSHKKNGTLYIKICAC